MPRYIGLLTAMAILLGAMLWRPARGCMLSNDPEPPPKHATPWDEPYDPDLEFLKESKVATDGPGLLKYLAERSGHDDDLLRVDELIRQLGSADFQTRRQAAEKLIAVGPPAHARLLETQKDKDPERARGARQTAESINRAWNFGLNLTVVRRLVKPALEASGGRGSSRAAQPGSAGASPSPGGSGKREGDVAQFPLAPGGRGDGGEGNVARALLQFLPYAADEECEEEIWFGLDSLAGGKSSGSRVHKNAGNHEEPRILENAATSLAPLADSLNDKLPIRRAAAGYLFTRRGTAEQRAAGKKFLADPDPLVRLRTAQGLLGAKDKDAIPVLIELLEKLRWTEEAWQAEEMLHYVAGDDAPETTIGTGSTEARQKCRKAWQQWWQTNSAKIDLNRLPQEYRRPLLALILVGDRPMNGEGGLLLVGCDEAPRWQMSKLSNPWAFHLFVGDRVLVAQHPTRQGHGRASQLIGPRGVEERDLSGKVLSLYKEMEFPIACRHLPNGDTLILENHTATKLSPERKPIISRDPRTPPTGGEGVPGECLELLGNDRILCGRDDYRQGFELFEYDLLTATVKRKIPLPQEYGHYCTAQPLPTGGYLISGPNKRRSLHEVNAKGKEVWQVATPLVLDAKPLRNGNILVLSGGFRLIEITRDSRIISEVFVKGGWRASPVLGLVGLGFDQPRPGELNLDTSISHRLKGLKHKDPFVRNASAFLLGELGEKAEAAIPDLIRAFSDPDTSVQSAACGALGKIGAPALQRLIEASSDDRSIVRLSAVRTLFNFQNQSKLVVPIFTKRLQDNDVLVRREAALALRTFAHFAPQSAEMIPALIDALKDKDEAKNLQEMSVPQMAVQALREFGPKARAAIPALIETLNTHDVYLRGYTIATLGEMGPDAKAAIPGVLKVLQLQSEAAGDSKEAVYTRCCVATFLAEIGGPEVESAIPALVDILKRKDLPAAYRQSAAKALGKMGPKAMAAVPALKEALSDPDPAVRERAVQAVDAITDGSRK